MGRFSINSPRLSPDPVTIVPRCTFAENLSGCLAGPSRGDAEAERPSGADNMCQATSSALSVVVDMLIEG